MKVAIVGAGRLGTALARRLTLAGHEVCFAFGPDPSNARAAAERLGVDADAPTAAAAWAEVVALTVPWAAAIDALRGCGDLGAKPVWDCTNPIKPDFSGLEIGTTTSAA
ncbi:MAG: NAD(P)-binding domain-containing protein, partial [Pseudomonadota bacterium]